MQLVIPARNEASRLPRTLAALRGHLVATGQPGAVEVIVVDNASTDDTAALARACDTPELAVRVVRCDQPGKGAAVREGMRHTTADVVGYMDADGATHLEALAAAVELLERGVDVAVGSRAVAGSRTSERHSAVRVVGARAYRRCTRWVASGLADTQCGFKVFRGDLARAVFSGLGSIGFSFDVEVLARAQRSGARVVEFPVVWDDVPGSTFVPLWHGGAAFWELAVIAHRLRREGAPARRAVLPATAATVAEA